nr:MULTISPECIES: DUF488 family protein [unclassified Pseudomonas]
MWTFAIGFTRPTARSLFTWLGAPGTKRLIDVRLNTASQLAGFAKCEDLWSFTRVLCGIEYAPLPLMAPTREMFEAYKIKGSGWALYAERFLALMTSRKNRSAR